MDPVSEEVLRSVSDSFVKNKAEYTKAINYIIEKAKVKVNAAATKINNLNDYSSTLSIIPVLNIFTEDKVFNAKKYKTSPMTVKIFGEVEWYAKFFEHRRIFKTDSIPESALEYCGLIDRLLSKAYHDYIINYKSLITDINNAGISISTLKFYLKNGFIPSKKVFDKDSLKHIAVNSLFVALILYFFTTVLIWLIH